jgi:cytochrome d ubiquinol oxidase subunit II
LRLAYDGQFDGNYLTGWLSPMALFTGFFVVVMCSYLAAVYLAREASTGQDDSLVQLWRRRALATGTWTGVLALAGMAYVATDAPLLWQGFREKSWPLVIASIIAGVMAQVALAREAYRAAVVSAAGAVTMVIWGWAAAQYPYLVPPTITVESAKAPDNILWLLMVTIAGGSGLLVPAILYLFYIFKTGRRPASDKPATAPRTAPAEKKR